ncbi:MAG: serine hydrolase domain-containing protein [Chloroflexota bacterium]|nr:serine hydrolase domain-containing protein [Chloroflexota bacterium]|tara:strand:+ start:78 stop:1286 length:1209 start_codon:yes stop_codon:yes gene_type:complete
MSNFNCDSFEQIEKNLDRLFVPKYYPGFILSIYENGNESFFLNKGYDDISKKIEYKKDSIFRIYSMTKPIVSTAAMQLIENKKLALDDDVTKYIPEWDDAVFYKSNNKNVITIKDLFTHTSGLTYAFQGQSEVDKKYKVSGINSIVDSELSSQEIINELSNIPLEFSPGSFYNYSISIDILGFIIERISNKTLNEYLHENIFNTLGMKDTAFTLDTSKTERLAMCYRWDENKNKYEAHDLKINPNIEVKSYLKKPSSYSGGAGLLSTMNDYQLFGSALLDAKKGRKNPLINKDTANLMMKNHLPNNKHIDQLSKYPLKGEQYYRGLGFGLGGSICIDENAGLSNSREGDFGWGGAASTSFYISDKYDYSLVFLTQVLESEETRKLNSEIKKLVNGCVDVHKE